MRKMIASTRNVEERRIRENVEAEGESETLTVRLTICFRRIDGEWMVTHEHHSEPSRGA
jgi:ketosteroid isomerase-like protein